MTAMSGPVDKIGSSERKRRSTRSLLMPTGTRLRPVYAAVVAEGRKARGRRAVDLLIVAMACASTSPSAENPDDFRGLEDLIDVVAVEAAPVDATGNPSRIPAIAKIVVFDIAGPLALYSWLRSQGWSTVTSLVVSGVLPAAGVILGIAGKRRIDVVGVVVLLGIAVGTALGLASGSARLVLLEGAADAIFGAACLGSLWASRPLMYRFALEFIGADTPRGRDFAEQLAPCRFPARLQGDHRGGGAAYLLEAAARVVIVESTSTGTALAISKVMPYAVAGVVAAWNVGYGRRARRRGERLGAEAHARGEEPPPMPQ